MLDGVYIHVYEYESQRLKMEAAGMLRVVYMYGFIYVFKSIMCVRATSRTH
jgi:hypothetical protein